MANESKKVSKRTVFTVFLLILGLLLPQFLSSLQKITQAQEQKTEIIEQRSANSKTYDNGDGTFTSDFWGLPVHYQDENDDWREIDTTIVSSDDPDYDFMNTTNTYKTYFSADAYGDKNNVKFQKGDAWVTFRTANKIKIKKKDEQGQEYVDQDLTLDDIKSKNKEEQDEKKGKKDANETNKIHYPKLYQKGNDVIDVSYTVLDNKLQEEIVLNQYQGFPEIPQEIELHNAYVKIEEDIIRFYHQDTNEFLWFIPEPKMHEQGNEDEASFALHFDLTCNDQDVAIEQCDKLTITKVFDQEGKDWLSDPLRQYPVVIDPDFIGSTPHSIDGKQDEDYSVTRSTSGVLFSTGSGNVGQNKNSSYLIYRQYLKFDTSSIPDDAVITQVQFRVYIFSDFSETDFDLQIVKDDWSALDPITTGNKEQAYDNCLSASADDSVLYNTSEGTGLKTSGNLSTSWISKTGSTYYCFRSSRDKNNNAPSGKEYIYFITDTAYGDAYAPTLLITYSTGAAPTNDSLTFTNPYGGDGNDAVADDTTEWNFQAQVSDTDGYVLNP